MSLPLLLLVDDAPEIGLLVRHLGRRAGYTLEHCLDGAAAWDYLQGVSAKPGRQPALVIFDYHLPPENGAVWCRRLLTTPGWASLPVALLSHWTRSAELVAGLRAGARYILSKELLGEPEAWCSRLREILTPAASRPPLLLPPCEATRCPPSLPEGWTPAFGRALEHPVVRQLGPEVLTILLDRVRQRLGPPVEEGYLRPDGAGLTLEFVPRRDRWKRALAWATALAEQLGCVLGAEGSAPFRAALAELFAPTAEEQSGS